jgi:MFS family permease
LGGVLIAEEWPEARRKNGAAFMHTGYYFGTFLAAMVNYTVGAKYGWRAVFAVGGAPALLVAFIRYGVMEPKRWRERTQTASGIWGPLAALFSAEYRRRTLINAALLFISMVGLWAGSAYVPASVMYLAGREEMNAATAARMASNATMLLSAGTILGCLLLAAIADRLGRRGSLAFYFTLMFGSIAFAFGCAFYLPSRALEWFIACLFFLGVGGANFAVYTLWLPEQYRTECRGSAFAFATSAGRFLAAGATFLVGAGISKMHTIGTPVACTSLAFLVGLAVLQWAEETKGKELPE